MYGKLMAYHRQGIGTRLLTACEDWARAQRFLREGYEGAIARKDDAGYNSRKRMLALGPKMMLDVPGFFQRDLAIQFPTNRLWQTFLYVQDKWQVNSKLTVDLGLRYDFFVHRDGRWMTGNQLAKYLVPDGGAPGTAA